MTGRFAEEATAVVVAVAVFFCSSTTRELTRSLTYTSPAASTATPVGPSRPVNGSVTWLP
jgi:hypothetical protein